ncbi:MAG: AMP-binding protein [Hyphomicrobiales bacterium]
MAGTRPAPGPLARFGAHERSIVHVLRRRVQDMPEKPWLVFEDRSVSFREADLLSNRLAHGLAGAGMAAGDTLLVMMPDSLEQLLTWIACAKLGVIEVPVNTAYRGDILAHLVQDSRAKAMVVSSAFLPRLCDLDGGTGDLGRCFVRRFDDADPTAPAGIAVDPFEALMSETDHPVGCDVDPQGLKAIMYTSGTTGRSKGVMVSHAHAFEYANGCASVTEVNETDVYYTAGLPLFHVAGKWGVVFGGAIKGATTVIPRQFSASNFWADVRRHGVTATYSLGAMANFLQRQPRKPDDAENPLKKMLMCPLLPDLDDFTRRFDVKVATAYGSTESCCPIVMPLGSPVTHTQVVGKVRSDLFEVKIFDDADGEAPRGTVGQIVVRPKAPAITMLGYWNQPQATIEMWRNLWLHTGDAGFEDESGNFHFTDRLKDAIRRRGENISSMEVEGILSRHPAILECAVFPVRSAYTEEEVMATVVLKPGHTAEPEGIIRFLEPRMAHFMVPRFIDIVEAMPKTPTGKVRKHLLREAGVTATTWDRELAGIKIAR